MRGRLHHLKLIGIRLQSGVGAGEPERDSEGRFVRSPTDPPLDVKVTEVLGRITYLRRAEGYTRQFGAPEESSTGAAHLPKGTIVQRGDELLAEHTGDPNLDGRYEITGVQAGRAMVRVMLRHKVV
jgi:hypothetical protein